MNEGRIGVYLSLGRKESSDIGKWALHSSKYPGFENDAWEINKSGHWQYFLTLDADAADEKDWARQHDWMFGAIGRLLYAWEMGLQADALNWEHEAKLE